MALIVAACAGSAASTPRATDSARLTPTPVAAPSQTPTPPSTATPIATPSARPLTATEKELQAACIDGEQIRKPIPEAAPYLGALFPHVTMTNVNGGTEFFVNKDASSSPTTAPDSAEGLAALHFQLLVCMQWSRKPAKDCEYSDGYVLKASTELLTVQVIVASTGYVLERRELEGTKGGCPFMITLPGPVPAAGYVIDPDAIASLLKNHDRKLVTNPRIPPYGSLWFGSSYNPKTFELTGKTDRVSRTGHVVIVAHLGSKVFGRLTSGDHLSLAIDGVVSGIHVPIAADQDLYALTLDPSKLPLGKHTYEMTFWSGMAYGVVEVTP